MSGAGSFSFDSHQVGEWLVCIASCGVPRLIVPDQARALIKNPDRYDPQPNRTYEEFAEHYGCALLAARPAHPRDKPKVEGAVLLVERWILARLRNRQFFSLGELMTPLPPCWSTSTHAPSRSCPVAGAAPSKNWTPQH